MSGPNVLIADALHTTAEETFRARGLEVRCEPGLAKDPAALRKAAAGSEGLAVRSAAKVDEEVFAAAPGLKVVGRAGVGVDNIDVAAATAAGVVVMNAPFANSVTTAEHTIAMLLALARHIPQANASLRQSRWERGKYVGTEVSGKSLGVVGCGNVGAEVARRAVGLDMRVLVHDPHLPAERAEALGATYLESLDDLLERSDFVTLHLPVTDGTKGLVNAERIGRMRPGARLINCARGALVDEAALVEALQSGRLGGAALDVFSKEPPQDETLISLPTVVSTPHLGASTAEAQELVARQIAEQMSDFLLEGAVANSVNTPSLSAAEAPRLRPWIAVAEMLGAFAGQVTDSPVREIGITCAGDAGACGTKALSAALIAALLRPKLGGDVNMVSAPLLARRRGMEITESVSDARGAFGSYIRLTVGTERQTRSVAGTVFSDGAPRIIQIKGVGLEARPQRHMLYATNVDQPGFIGALGSMLGEAGLNIATFALGRDCQGGEAITLIGLDEPASEEVLERIRGLRQVKQVKAVQFP